MLSLDNFSQDPVLMQEATEFAKEIAVFFKQRYPNIPKTRYYKAIIGYESCWNEIVIPKALLFKLKEMLNEPCDKSPFLDEEPAKMVEEVFEIIKENYSGDVDKLHRLKAVLEDYDASSSLLIDMCNQ
jgi:hypothetical protein